MSYDSIFMSFFTISIMLFYLAVYDIYFILEFVFNAYYFTGRLRVECVTEDGSTIEAISSKPRTFMISRKTT